MSYTNVRYFFATPGTPFEKYLLFEDEKMLINKMNNFVNHDNNPIERPLTANYDIASYITQEQEMAKNNAALVGNVEKQYEGTSVLTDVKNGTSDIILLSYYPSPSDEEFVKSKAIFLERDGTIGNGKDRFKPVIEYGIENGENKLIAIRYEPLMFGVFGGKIRKSRKAARKSKKSKKSNKKSRKASRK
jgi:hypothetical protein